MIGDGVKLLNITPWSAEVEPGATQPIHQHVVVDANGYWIASGLHQNTAHLIVEAVNSYKDKEA